MPIAAQTPSGGSTTDLNDAHENEFNDGMQGIPLGILQGMSPEEYAALPHGNFGTLMLAVAWPLVFIAFVFLCMRFYCKYIGRKRLWWDDYVLIGAWISMVAQCSILTTGVVNYQFGRNLYDLTVGPAKIAKFFGMLTVNHGLSILGACWAKTSFGLTVLRLLLPGWMRWLVLAVIISINIIMGMSILLLFVWCRPLNKSWNPLIEGGECLDLNTTMGFHVAAAAYSAIMDLILAIIPWKLIWGLQMRKQEKIGISIAMSFGVFAGCGGFIKASKIASQTSDEPHQTVTLLISGFAENAACTCAACIPVLSGLFRGIKFSTKWYKYTGASGNSNVHQASKGSSSSSTGTGSVNNSKRSCGLGDVAGGRSTSGAGAGTNIVSITSSNKVGMQDQYDVELKRMWSDTAKHAAIMRTSEVSVRYDPRKKRPSEDYDLESLGLENKHSTRPGAL